ncbi:protoporphyrinogen/coproporphyrinogen oxidase, partial [Streptomyces sp. NPDC059558]|uniref:protoporphyrinogen/coproporphyrinogen oxidase n=1 Tax=Streptomyces sp. NPDC059558 TaxID=3346864 RepID=UPI00369E7450
RGAAPVSRRPRRGPPPPGRGAGPGGSAGAPRGAPEVVDRLVEPLLGGVYAGDAYRISMRAAVPQLFEAARTHALLGDGVRELQRRAEAAPQPPGPVFAGIDGGIGRLPLAVAEACRAAGARLVTGAPVREVLRTADGWRVVAGAEAIEADAVILATPAGAAARLLDGLAPTAAAELRGVEYASMALITMAFRRRDLPGGGAGRGGHRKIAARGLDGNVWHTVLRADGSRQ